MTTTLVNLYDALTAAGAPENKARAAVQSVEESRDEPWKRKMEAENAGLRTEMREGFARLETKVNTVGGVIISLLVGVILVGVGILVQV